MLTNKSWHYKTRFYSSAVKVMVPERHPRSRRSTETGTSNAAANYIIGEQRKIFEGFYENLIESSKSEADF
jgi:hypothetical protein